MAIEWVHIKPYYEGNQMDLQSYYDLTGGKYNLKKYIEYTGGVYRDWETDRKSVV